MFYLGNDINCKDAIKIVGITFCRKDAHESVKTIVNYTLKNKGGIAH
jgi:3-deoxy-D-manno-octulosonate 8-phosphate phosphatase KdsC-like HAD superfamily phosphatase